MEVDQAVDFFDSAPAIAHPSQLLKDVGLGYIDPGPEGAPRGGCVVRAGPLEQLVAQGTHTALALAPVLARA